MNVQTTSGIDSAHCRANDGPHHPCTCGQHGHVSRVATEAMFAKAEMMLEVARAYVVELRSNKTEHASGIVDTMIEAKAQAVEEAIRRMDARHGRSRTT